MKTGLSICAVVFALVLTVSASAGGSENLQQEYENWVQSYRQGALVAAGPEGHSSEAALLRITAVEGDNLPVNPQQARILGAGYRTVFYGCTVSVTGVTSYFQNDAGGSSGSGYPVLPERDLERLKLLISKLPDDGSQLPPPGRRLVIQASVSGGKIVRIYDRADMPDQVLEIIRVARAHIQPWTIRFQPKRAGSTLDFSKAGIEVPSYETFSPDKSLRVAQGDYDVVVVGKAYSNFHELREPEINRHVDSLFGPVFTPDGRYLLLESSHPAIRIYDTNKWQLVGTLPGMPDDAVAYFPDKLWERAVFASVNGSIELWDSTAGRAIANLGKGQLLDAVFSPDQLLVAAAILEKFKDGATAWHVRVWRADDGAFVSELQPSDQIQPPGFVAGFGNYSGMLAWLPESQYLLTVVRPHSFFTDRNIAIWDVQSGHYRGDLTGCITAIDQFKVSMGDGRVFAECYGGGPVIWDLEWDARTAVSRLREFERSLNIHQSKGN